MVTDPIHDLRDRALNELAQAGDAAALEQWRIRYLGTKGQVKQVIGQLRDVPPQERKAFGQAANDARTAIEQAFDQAKLKLGSDASTTAGGPMLDLTEPGLPPTLGRQHVITQTIAELVDVFARMGFDVATGPEVEDERHNFTALNIPATHPARDPLDNFYLTDEHADTPTLLRSQTSTVQVRVMEHTRPPVRVIATGRVYRPDEHDATHYSMFHQVEGLYVNRGVSMAELKTTLIQFARAMFGPDADIKLVPSYFPFTEPSAELYVKMDFGQGPQWMEIGGCGMVDPAVFKHVGYDPEEWTGFAFGLGIERLAMRKHQIADIRWLFENDVRFLRQF